MSEPPSTTRKRVEPDLPATADGTVTRSKIWMPYGDIILQAETTQFRVSRDILAAQSPVFRDMFGVPQPQNEPTIEGCPIVHVSDTAQDWELLLEVLYHPFVPRDWQPYPVIASMLRLGKKYDMQEPKEAALQRIRAEFPNTLAEYDSNSEVVDWEYGSLLNLLHECGVQSSIPTVSMACLAYHSFTETPCALGLDKILDFQRQSLSWLYGNHIIPHKSCKSRKTCPKAQKSISDLINGREKHPYHVSYTIDWWEEDKWDDQLCDVCEAAAKEAYEASRRKGWEMLPSFFGLGTWEDLKDLV
ncbi:hypothetical protein C8R46DRAFT_1061938 [Mycena filopes]|nr:hypothetical protein C8R46DRAFT_1061938 [Mycena filopes]